MPDARRPAPSAETPRAIGPAARRPLRAAVIGTGFIGPHHVDAIRRTGYGEVVAIAGTNPARLEACARALGIERTSLDVDAIVGDPAIDVVHVCTTNATHVPIASAALEAGKHVVVEKPVALTAADARGLDARARRAGRFAMVSYTYRGYPMVRRMRALVAEGRLGEVWLVHGHYLQDWLARDTDYNWRIDPAVGGASRAIADIGTHFFDTAEFVSGRRVEAVLADLATFIPSRERPLTSALAFGMATGPSERVAIESEDAGVILLRFAGGARGAFVVSQVSPGHKNDLTLEVSGALRSVRWHQESPERAWLASVEVIEELVRAPGEVSPAGVPELPHGHPEGYGEAFRDLFRPFYAAIASGAEPPGPDEPAPYPTLRDGTRAVAFVEAVLRSSAEGAWAPLADG